MRKQYVSPQIEIVLTDLSADIAGLLQSSNDFGKWKKNHEYLYKDNEDQDIREAIRRRRALGDDME